MLRILSKFNILALGILAVKDSGGRSSMYVSVVNCSKVSRLAPERKKREKKIYIGGGGVGGGGGKFR